MALFFFIAYVNGNCPVSVSRVLVGFRVGVLKLFLLPVVVNCLELIFLLSFQPSDPYVIIDTIVASNSCQMAWIFRSLNSLLPVSVIMFCVAAWILVSIASMWASMLFFLLITLHFSAPNSMWYYSATWFVMSSISCSVLRSWCMRQTSSIHRRVFTFSPVSVTIPRSCSFNSFDISSMSVVYSITDSSPPCLILSLILS